MGKGDKELLIQDLCARLPYKPQVQIKKDGISITDKLTTATIKYLECVYWDVKPYLFPLSSMTDEQKVELLEIVVGKEGSKYFKVLSDGSICSTDAKEQDLNNFVMHIVNFDRKTTASYIDWLNKNHFDYRGFIKKGLANDATNLNIY